MLSRKTIACPEAFVITERRPLHLDPRVDNECFVPGAGDRDSQLHYHSNFVSNCLLTSQPLFVDLTHLTCHGKISQVSRLMILHPPLARFMYISLSQLDAHFLINLSCKCAGVPYNLIENRGLPAFPRKVWVAMNEFNIIMSFRDGNINAMKALSSWSEQIIYIPT